MSENTSLKVSVRKVTLSDFDEVLEVYAAAREFMRQTGNPDQWGTNRPKVSVLREDVELERLYAITIPADNNMTTDSSSPNNSSFSQSDAAQGREHLKKDIICGCFAFYDGPDPTYSYIEDGSWPSDAPYKVIHSIAGNGTLKGILKIILDYCEPLSNVLRIDTYKDNQIMQHLLSKYGFDRCGIIYVDNGTPRIAYQKTIK